MHAVRGILAVGGRLFALGRLEGGLRLSRRDEKGNCVEEQGNYQLTHLQGNILTLLGNFVLFRFVVEGGGLNQPKQNRKELIQCALHALSAGKGDYLWKGVFWKGPKQRDKCLGISMWRRKIM